MRPPSATEARKASTVFREATAAALVNVALPRPNAALPYPVSAAARADKPPVLALAARTRRSWGALSDHAVVTLAASA